MKLNKRKLWKTEIKLKLNDNETNLNWKDKI